MASNVEMRFEDGSRINAWLQFTMRDTYTDPLGEMTFTAAPPRDRIKFYQERLVKGDVVSILVNQAPQGVFIIQSVDEAIGKSGVIFSMTCHTPLVTAYQGCIEPDFSFSVVNADPLTTVLLNALAPYGFDSIVGDTGASVAAASGLPIGKTRRKRKVSVEALKTAEAHAQDGERAYAFCARLLTRLGLQMRMDVSAANLGTLMVEAPDYEQEAAAIVVLDPIDAPVPIPGTRFLGDPPVVIHSSNDDQYSECTVRGAARDVAGQTSTDQPIQRVTAEGLNPSSPQYSSVAAAYKPLFITDKQSRDAERSLSAAKLAMGIRALKAFSITGEVDELVAHNDSVWTAGTMIRVVIPDKQIDEPMFLYERTMTMSREGGKRTRLMLIPKGALVLGDVPGGG